MICRAKAPGDDAHPDALAKGQEEDIIWLNLGLMDYITSSGWNFARVARSCAGEAPTGRVQLWDCDQPPWRRPRATESGRCDGERVRPRLPYRG